MTASNMNEGLPPVERDSSDTAPPASGADRQTSVKALPRPTRPTGSGWVDVTGIMPEGIRIDPDITEGHPGYEESGESEIIPTERFSAGEPNKGKDTPD